MKRVSLTLAALVLIAATANAQTTDLQQLVAGNSLPHTLKLKELDATWRSVTVATTDQATGSYSDMLTKLMQVGMMRGGGSSDMAGMAMMSGLFGGGGGSSAPSYTKGQTIQVAGETFLVTYKLGKSGPDIMDLIMESASTGKEPDMAALLKGSTVTEDAPVALTLVNVKSITSLGVLKPFDLKQAIADAGKGNEMLKAMMSGRSVQGSATPDVPEATVAPAPVETAKPAPKPTPKPTTKPKPRTGK